MLCVKGRCPAYSKHSANRKYRQTIIPVEVEECSVRCMSWCGAPSGPQCSLTTTLTYEERHVIMMRKAKKELIKRGIL